MPAKNRSPTALKQPATASAPPAAKAPRPKTQRRSNARDRILETALDLFYKDGTRAVGVDRLIAESGVAKMTFYNQFPSKDDIICAFLEERHQRWMTWFQARFDTLSKNKTFTLPIVADVLAEWFKSKDFRGCAFINIFAETTAKDARQRTIAKRHKQDLLEFLTSIAHRDGLSNPEDCARLALMAIEGAIVRASMTGNAAGASADCHTLINALIRNQQ